MLTTCFITDVVPVLVVMCFQRYFAAFADELMVVATERIACGHFVLAIVLGFADFADSIVLAGSVIVEDLSAPLVTGGLNLHRAVTGNLLASRVVVLTTGALGVSLMTILVADRSLVGIGRCYVAGGGACAANGAEAAAGGVCLGLGDLVAQSAGILVGAIALIGSNGADAGHRIDVCVSLNHQIADIADVLGALSIPVLSVSDLGFIVSLGAGSGAGCGNFRNVLQSQLEVTHIAAVVAVGIHVSTGVNYIVAVHAVLDMVVALVDPGTGLAVNLSDGNGSRDFGTGKVVFEHSAAGFVLPVGFIAFFLAGRCLARYLDCFVGVNQLTADGTVAQQQVTGTAAGAAGVRNAFRYFTGPALYKVHTRQSVLFVYPIMAQWCNIGITNIGKLVHVATIVPNEDSAAIGAGVVSLITRIFTVRSNCRCGNHFLLAGRMVHNMAAQTSTILGSRTTLILNLAATIRADLCVRTVSIVHIVGEGVFLYLGNIVTYLTGLIMRIFT